VNTIGGFASALGTACKCDPWAVEIFAEEVVRGGPAFAISLVISGVEPRLRQLAELGAWQVGLNRRGVGGWGGVLVGRWRWGRVRCVWGGELGARQTATGVSEQLWKGKGGAVRDRTSLCTNETRVLCCVAVVRGFSTSL